MKNKTVKALAIAMTVATVTMMGSASIYASDDTAETATEETADDAETADDTEEASDDDQAAADEVVALSDKNASDDTAETTTEENAETTEAADGEEASDDQKAADKVAALIDKIYVQERTDTTDEDCKAAKEAWDKLTDAQKKLVEGEEADPDYFGRDTGDASKDDPRNQDEIGENELLVVSFGTSFNDSRAEDIKGIEDKLQEAYPDWSVRRAFTAQIIINHVEARDDEVIDNMQQALDRAVDNGVKNLVVQPTHLMHGAEYDEMTEAIDGYKDKFESVAIAEPMLGEVGDDATVINDDKKAVAQAITDEACKEAGYDSMEAAAKDGTAFVFMGHGTSHTANVTYDQMQSQMDNLGFKNAFIGTVEGKPEDTECQAVIAKVKDAGFKKVVLRPLMVVAGDHANNDMAGDDDDSWKSQFDASGAFDSVDCQIAGLGRIEAVEDLYVEHTKAAIDSLGTADTAEEKTDGLDCLPGSPCKIRRIYIMKRSVAMMACVLSGALMIGGYSPVLAKTEAKAVSATATDKDGAEAKTDAAKADDKKEDTAKGEVLEDGVYSAEFDTDSGMFHVNEANDGKGTLTVKDGKMTLHVSLASKNIVNLFVGTAEDAQKDGAELLEPTTDTVTYSDGMTEEVYGFDIPVPAIDEEFDLALIGKKNKWYDHKVKVTNPQKEEADADAAEDTAKATEKKDSEK